MRISDINTPQLDEKWSSKYKKSINCSHPKGFSQKAHCAARRKRQAGGKTKSRSVHEAMTSVNEAKLTHRDPVEVWIARFKSSTHPRFAGKSMAEREKQARMAHYRAVQNHNPFKAPVREPEVDEAKKQRKSTWDVMAAALRKDGIDIEKRSQEAEKAKQELKRLAKEYQDIVDRDTVAKAEK